MKQEKWLLCPVCGNKTRLKLREDTVLEKFPLFCPKCKQETLINVRFLPHILRNNLLVTPNRRLPVIPSLKIALYTDYFPRSMQAGTPYNGISDTARHPAQRYIP